MATKRTPTKSSGSKATRPKDANSRNAPVAKSKSAHVAHEEVHGATKVLVLEQHERDAEAVPSSRLELLLERVEAPAGVAQQIGLPVEAKPPTSPGVSGGIRSAQLVKFDGLLIQVRLRGSTTDVDAVLAEDVDRELIQAAAQQGDSVLVETGDDGVPMVVGVLQTKVPTDITIKASNITFEAEREMVFRAGRAGLRLREDGDVELVGSRVSAMSRGLFRIVGRILRLN